MLLKIEVFPAGEPLRSSSSSNTSNNSNNNNKNTTLDAAPQHQLPIESSQPPLYVCLGTSGKPASSYSDGDGNNDIPSDYVDPDAGRLLTVGRSKVTSPTTTTAPSSNTKPMVLIPATDKSVSREHCLLRLVCSSKTAMMKEFEYHPRPMPSRNEQEEEACCRATAENNAAVNNLCVVVESMGKLGTYLVVEPQQADSKDDTPSKKAKKIDNSEDDETDDDEDPSSALQVSQQQQQQTQQSKSQSSVLLLPALSDATKQIIGPKNVPGTTLIPIENSLVLEALSNNNNGRVILQCGKMGSTIVISRVALHFVQAGGSSSSSSRKTKTATNAITDAPWYKRVYMIGATEGETVSWNNNNNSTTPTTTPTTLVLTAAYNATPKQLAAWSRGIPLVTPDFMQAMLQRANPHHIGQDSLPKFDNFKPKPDGNAFWNKMANPKLWSGTIFLSTQDASSSSSTSKKTSSNSTTSNSDATEMLVASAGATIVRLYEMSTEQLQDLARRLETDTVYSNVCFGLQHSSSSSSSSSGGRGVRRTKSSSKGNDSVVAVAAAKLLQDYNIPLFSTRTLAKILTEQQPLATSPEGRVIGQQDGINSNNSNAASTATVTEKTSTLEESRMENAAASRGVQENDKDVEMQQQPDAVQETPPVDSSASSSKRRRQRDNEEQEGSKSNSASQRKKEESASLLLEQSSKKQRHLSPVVEEEPATSAAAAAAAASKNDKEALRTLEQQQSQSGGSGGGDKNDKTASSSRSEKDKRNAASQEINQDKESNDTKKSKSKSNKENSDNHHHHQGKRCSLAASTTKQGWLVAAPSKDSKRQAYLRSRTEIKEQGGYEDLGPVAETEVVKGLLRSTNATSGQQGQQSRLGTSSASTAATGPDFKRFWKNEIAGRETNIASARHGAAGRNGHGHGRHRRRFVLKMANKNKGDSIMQVEFHEERQAVEEEQRKADQLFSDPGTAAAAPRRRRKA